MPSKKSKTDINTKRSLEAQGYYSDKHKAGMLYAAIIRSPAATGKITEISIPDLPDNYNLYTANNIPGKKSISEGESNLNIFAWKSVNYTGEPLGIIVGPDYRTVQELKEQANVSFDISTLESALKKVINKSKHPLVPTELSDLVSTFNELPSLNNVIDSNNTEQITEKQVGFREIKTGMYKNITDTETKEYLSQDATIVTGKFNQKLSSPQWEEPDGAFAYYENSELHIYTPTKWTSFVQKKLSDSLSIPLEKIFIHKTKSADINANGLWRTTQLAIQTALAAVLSKKPVKLMLSRSEQKDYMSPNIDADFSFESIVTKNGIIKAFNAHIDVDVGYLNPFAQEIADRLSIAVCNYYRTDNLHITTNVHTSQKPPTSFCIKRADSQSFFAIENHIQQIAIATGFLPDDLRLLNRNLGSTDFPFLISLGEISDTIKSSIKISDFNRKYTSFKMDAIDRVRKESNPFFALPLRGIGLSTAYNASGYFGTTAFTFDPKIEVTLTTEEKVIIHALQSSSVIQNIWKNTVSEILQIPKENISIDSQYDIKDFPKSPEECYSSIGIMNDLLKKCCNDIQKKRFHQPLPIVSKKEISSTLRKNWNKDTFSGNPFHTTSFASTVVEVELDSFTYTEKIKGIWIAIDCGELYDEVAAEKSLLLEVQQELTTLVKGTTITCNNCTIEFVKSKTKSGQIGELIHNTLPAAFSSALSMALQTQLSELPCTEEQIFTLIKNRETLPEVNKQNNQQVETEPKE